MLWTPRPEKIIKKNYRIFERKKKRALLEKNTLKKIKLIEKAAYWAAYNTCGVYASPELEAALCQIAQTSPTPKDITPKPNSRLHVMTTSYKTGGHTRVVDQWIANKPEGQHHDVIILNQLEGHLPEYLVDTIKMAGGTLTLAVPSDDKIADALKLRKLACKYEKVILHHHMEDATPTLAFGTETFKRPVITFDHAEHMFWLGASVTDVSAVLSPDTIPFSMERRGVQALFLPIPTKVHPLHPKTEARARLNIAQGKKVLLSIGGDFRFKPSKEYNFIRFCEELFKTVPHLMVVIVGVTPTNKYWQNLKNRHGDNLLLTGLVKDKNLYYDYIAAADVYVESLPIGGETTSLEVAVTNTPTLVLEKPMRRSSAWAGYPATDIADLTEKTVAYLKGKTGPDTAFAASIMSMHSPLAFTKHILEIESQAPQTHSLHSIPEEKVRISEYDLFLIKYYGGIRTNRLRKFFRRISKKLGLVKSSKA